MFTFTDAEWHLIEWTDFEASAQSHEGHRWPFTPAEFGYYYDQEDHTYTPDVLAKICQRFTMQLNDFEDEEYYFVCTSLNWDDAQALRHKMEQYLKSHNHPILET